MGWEGVMGMPWGEACVVIVRGEGRRGGLTASEMLHERFTVALQDLSM